MPVVTLSDLARVRLQTLSFFLVGFLVSAWLIQLLWNGLRRDFSRLPRLSYCKALGVTSLWGLLFVLVLTMIAGARELLTPGAWEKQGTTYKIKGPVEEEPAPAGPTERDRENHLLRLRTALWDYARRNENILPARLENTDVPSPLRCVPDSSGVPYIYVRDLKVKAGEGVFPLVYEPEVFGPTRMVLFTNGEVRRMTLDDILALQPGGTPR